MSRQPHLTPVFLKKEEYPVLQSIIELILNPTTIHLLGVRAAPALALDLTRRMRSPRHAILCAARIRIFWPLDDKWYPGTIVSYDAVQERHQVLYDDEDTRWYDLPTRRWAFLDCFDG